jgi:hypothetical protein
MSELPPPDVMDSAGRMRRLVLAFVVGVVVASIAYMVTNAMAKPDAVSAAQLDGEVTTSHGGGAYKFVWYMTAFFGAAAFATTLAIANHRAKNAWKRDRDVPQAKQVT